MPKLTKTFVESLSVKDKQYTSWCSELKGFGVSINPAGSRSYIVDYRSPDGARRRMTIGRHGPLTTEEARKLAIKTLGSTLHGEDPAMERRTRRASLTVSELCDNYLQAAANGLILARGGQPKKPKGIAADKSAIDAHIKPLLGSKLVIDLKRTDVVKFIRDVQAGKTAVASTPSGKLRGRIRVVGGSGAATRSAATLGAMMSYAISVGIIDDNPSAGVKKPAIQKRDRRLTAAEYKMIGDTLREFEVDPTKAWQGVAMMWLIAFTGCRSGEIQNLKWSEVDMNARVIRLLDSKTGKSVRPLSMSAVAILEKLPRGHNDAFIFSAARLSDLPYAGFRRFHLGLFKQAGLDGVTPHVLRHSFASVGGDLGFTDSTIGACLGHAGLGITSRYTHILDSVVIAAADKISGEIAYQMGVGY